MEINAEHVPRYPEVRLERTVGNGLLCDGVPVDVGPHEDIVRRGIEACAARALEILGPKGVIRVRAITQSGDVHFLAVSADGDAIDMPDPDATPASALDRAAMHGTLSRRALLGGAAAVTGVAVLGGGAAGLWALRASRSVPVPTTPPPPPGRGDLLPVVTPHGVDETAIWSLPVQPTRPLCYLATPHMDGILVTRPDGTTVCAHPITGATLWTITGYQGGSTRVMTIAGRSFLVEMSAAGLRTWSIPSPGVTGTSAPAPEPLRADAAAVTLISTSPMPLAILPTQTVQAFARTGTLTDLDVPAGYTPVGATPTHVVSVSASTHTVLAQSIDDAEAEPIRFAIPPVEAGYTMLSAYMLGPRLLVVWGPTPGYSTSPVKPVAVLCDLDFPVAATEIARTSIPVMPSASTPPQSSPRGDVMVVGGIMCTATALHALDGTVTTVTDAGVYHVVDKDLVFTDVAGMRFIVGAAQAVAPNLQLDGTAYFLAAKLDETRVYATQGQPAAIIETPATTGQGITVS